MIGMGVGVKGDRFNRVIKCQQTSTYQIVVCENRQERNIIDIRLLWIL